ncbi:MAG TPA: ABC transporter permease [Actinomycetes bacterium]|jgi:peptide/nickel transport system permease protein|nr:ABC transporter permease [Actinomycetes bacterium]
MSVGEQVSAELDSVRGRQGRRAVRGERWRVLRRSPTFLVGAVVVGFWVVCAVFGSLIETHDPFAVNVLHRLARPSSSNWFGTDELGRDVFSRVIAGARGILVVAPLATAIGTVAGTAIGLVTGYYRGAVDDILMRVVDAVLALPAVVVGLLALVALGPSNVTVIVVIGLVFTPIIARTVRAAVLAERELEYVQAAKLRNERAPYVMFVEILPNVTAPILVEFTVRLGYAIFLIATLSFLGFGIQPPAPDWGVTIFNDYGFLPGGIWWPTLFPAIAIASLVVGVNLVSDALTQVFER